MLDFVKEEKILDSTLIEFDIVDGNKVYGKFKIELLNDKCNVHNDIFIWSHHAAKVCREDYDSLKSFAKARGADKITAVYGESLGSVDKWKKFIKLMGMPEPQELFISTLEI